MINPSPVTVRSVFDTLRQAAVSCNTQPDDVAEAAIHMATYAAILDICQRLVIELVEAGSNTEGFGYFVELLQVEVTLAYDGRKTQPGTVTIVIASLLPPVAEFISQTLRLQLCNRSTGQTYQAQPAAGLPAVEIEDSTGCERTYHETVFEFPELPAGLYQVRQLLDHQFLVVDDVWLS